MTLLHLAVPRTHGLGLEVGLAILGTTVTIGPHTGTVRFVAVYGPDHYLITLDTDPQETP